MIPQPLSWRALSSRDLLPALSSRAELLFGFDLRSLALLRIGLGGVLVADLLQRSAALSAHYTDEGVLPSALIHSIGAPGIGLYRLFGGVVPVAALGILSIASALALMVGFHTRIAAIASWVLLVSLQNRNPFVYHSGDDLLRLVLFWGMFLPLGARWSADARQGSAAPSSTTRFVSIGTIGLFLQLFYLFLFLFGHKLMGTAWRNGTAVYDALSVEQYRSSLGSMLLGVPGILPFLTDALLIQQGLTFVLLATPILVGPLRVLVVLSVVATQVGFGLCFTLGTFPWITSIAILAVLPGWFWEKVFPNVVKVKNQLSSEEPRAAFRAARLGRIVIAGISVLSIASITLWNLSQAGAKFGVAGSEVAFEETLLGRFALVVRLDQRWSMFSPNPQTEDGWFVIEGTLANGSRADLLPAVVNGALDSDSVDRVITRGIRWGKPSLISSQFRDQRWLLYFLQLVGSPTEVQRQGFADYVCRFWNGAERRDKALRRFALDYMKFEHLPEGKTSAVEKTQLVAADCPAI